MALSLVMRRGLRRAAGLAPRVGAVAPRLAPAAACVPIRWHGGAGTFDAGAEDVRVVFVAGDGKETEVVAKAGQDLLDIAHRNDIDMEGACEGSIACSTCHVILDDDVFDKLEEATEEEVRPFALVQAGRVGAVSVRSASSLASTVLAAALPLPRIAGRHAGHGARAD